MKFQKCKCGVFVLGPVTDRHLTAAGMNHSREQCVPKRGSVAAEQDAYRAGWVAGARRRDGFPGVRQLSNLGFSAATSVDLGKLAYESRASSDRAASQAHAEREYWADGIDPDDV
jgi:hypothetical protein